MSYNQVISQFKATFQQAYRQVVDADAQLEQLRHDGHGKFDAVFPEGQGFTTKANKFMPYLEEVVGEFDRFEAAPSADKLPSLVQKLELLLSTLARFRESMKTPRE
ncbi:prephenate dehydrogenase [Ferrimonas sediminicola]|uniref:Prephenate dehydrogenase n=1 Tax=Ferrimonas sediminicola TaxID=2569538 RepID=A0A4U1BIM8_9GAMM|nr:prephenate dehydrogenase [Ferrimonas sediminicola]TKB51356.1 prephenate dehydrogenase [Ferrimonas sediminicola]